MNFDQLLKKLKGLKPEETVYLCKHIYDVNIIVGNNVFTPSKAENEFQMFAEFLEKNQNVRNKVYKSNTFLKSNYEFILIKDSKIDVPYLIENYVILDGNRKTLDEMLICISMKAVREQLSKLSQVKYLFSDLYPVNEQDWLKLSLI